ncbi:hypothetical protein CTI12_AA307670 [Artemisia annua]|uniref:Uncharacterized protein n=1 Tax=Artemisia annua TaxID=35608 RepID=A0A2U1N586_ARTAN|nr:hypothetical protein CTI12_AA307670 [Artemisia annua]
MLMEVEQLEWKRVELQHGFDNWSTLIIITSGIESSGTSNMSFAMSGCIQMDGPTEIKLNWKKVKIHDDGKRINYPSVSVESYFFRTGNNYKPFQGRHPNNVILLACDAFGVLPPVSKLNLAQTMYHFINAYTTLGDNSQCSCSHEPDFDALAHEVTDCVTRVADEYQNSQFQRPTSVPSLLENDDNRCRSVSEASTSVGAFGLERVGGPAPVLKWKAICLEDPLLDNSGTSLGESLDLRPTVKAISVEGATLDNDHNVVSVCAETILTPALGGNSRLYQTMSMQAACQSVPNTVYFPIGDRPIVSIEVSDELILGAAIDSDNYSYQTMAEQPIWQPVLAIVCFQGLRFIQRDQTLLSGDRQHLYQVIEQVVVGLRQFIPSFLGVMRRKLILLTIINYVGVYVGDVCNASGGNAFNTSEPPNAYMYMIFKYKVIQLPSLMNSHVATMISTCGHVKHLSGFNEVLH